jgi:hypothetical protein
VRGFDAQTQTWLVFDPSKADNDPANTLHQLEFGKGYEITVTQNVTLRLKGDGVGPSAAAAAVPALYHGTVEDRAISASATGVPVVARVDGRVCGQGVAWAEGGRMRYFVAVLADGPGAQGCGAPGRRVTFEVGGKVMATTATWDGRSTGQFRLK